MKGRVINWLKGWKETISIMLFDRETYKYLREPVDDSCFIEVDRPEKEEN